MRPVLFDQGSAKTVSVSVAVNRHVQRAPFRAGKEGRTVVTATYDGTLIADYRGMSLSNVRGDCPECASLLGHYEALTFEQARVHNSLDIAKLLSDRASARKLTISAYAITKRRDAARNVLIQHQATVHDLSVAA
jgi:hypothetical protein